MKIQDFNDYKAQNKKICMLTCYDYASSRIICETKTDCVLVGDSLAMVVHGFDSTVMATMDMMSLHTKAVARGIKQQFLISDMPFLGHKISRENTFKNAKELIQAGAHGLKIEGGDSQTLEMIHELVISGIPVMGHIGLTPQSVHQLGGHRVQGKDTDSANKLIQQAKLLEKAGCFAIVLECIPEILSQKITEEISIATIGIGAGKYTNGQVLVWHDILGLQWDFNPRFIKKYLNGGQDIINAINQYVNEVKNVHFPTKEHIF